jgi:hypothetical protein
VTVCQFDQCIVLPSRYGILICFHHLTMLRAMTHPTPTFQDKESFMGALVLPSPIPQHLMQHLLKLQLMRYCSTAAVQHVSSRTA